MKKYRNIRAGGGIMADKIKYGCNIVGHIPPGADMDVVNEFFSLISAAPDMYKYLFSSLPEDCSGGKECVHCLGLSILERLHG